VSRWVTLSLGVLFVSVGAVLVRLAAAPPLAIAFYRVALASLVLCPFAGGAARRSWPALDGRRRLLMLVAGTLLALHFACWIASLSFTSIASSVLLVNTAPLFAIAFSRWFLGERTPGIVLRATPLALAGAALIAYGDWTGASGSMRGNLLALMGAVTLAGYHVVGRGLRDALPLDAYVLVVWTAAAVVLAVIALAAGVPLHGYSAASWAVFAALALVPTLGGHGLVNKSLRALPAPTVGLFLLGEPIVASALGFLLLAEAPGVWTLTGGALVLLALSVVVASGGPAEAAPWRQSSR
jgi:drug/metabolite transporter (DMT)-like permease